MDRLSHILNYIIGFTLGIGIALVVCVVSLIVYDLWTASALREDFVMWQINRRKKKAWNETKRFIRSIKEK